MNDRELLELAAKAAGYPFDNGHFEEAEKPGAWWGMVYIDGAGDPPNDYAWTELWNPLTDDGDSLRLAVKLKLALEMTTGNCTVFAGDNAEPIASEMMDREPCAATRRAIVRAAAEIGRNA